MQDGETEADMKTILLKPGQRLVRYEKIHQEFLLRTKLYCEDNSLFVEFRSLWVEERYDITSYDLTVEIFGEIRCYKYPNGLSCFYLGFMSDPNDPRFINE